MVISSVSVTQSAFVGRENELKNMVKLMRDSLTGKGQFVIVEGEAGIGKTRLINELGKLAGEDDFEVLSTSDDLIEIKLAESCKYDQQWFMAKYRVVTDLRKHLETENIRFIEEYASVAKAAVADEDDEHDHGDGAEGADTADAETEGGPDAEDEVEEVESVEEGSGDSTDQAAADDAPDSEEESEELP